MAGDDVLEVDGDDVVLVADALDDARVRERLEDEPLELWEALLVPARRDAERDALTYSMWCSAACAPASLKVLTWW